MTLISYVQHTIPNSTLFTGTDRKFKTEEKERKKIHNLYKF
jgi:hypothetical protein